MLRKCLPQYMRSGYSFFLGLWPLQSLSCCSSLREDIRNSRLTLRQANDSPIPAVDTIIKYFDTILLVIHKDCNYNCVL